MVRKMITDVMSVNLPAACSDIIQFTLRAEATGGFGGSYMHIKQDDGTTNLQFSYVRFETDAEMEARETAAAVEPVVDYDQAFENVAGMLDGTTSPSK